MFEFLNLNMIILQTLFVCVCVTFDLLLIEHVTPWRLASTIA